FEQLLLGRGADQLGIFLLSGSQRGEDLLIRLRWLRLLASHLLLELVLKDHNAQSALHYEGPRQLSGAAARGVRSPVGLVAREGAQDAHGCPMLPLEGVEEVVFRGVGGPALG